MAKDNVDSVTEPVKSSKKKHIIISSIIALLVAVGGGGAYYFVHKSNHSGTSQHDESVEPVFVKLESFVVNLQPNGDKEDHYVQTEITIQAVNDAGADVIKLHTAEVRNRILTILSSKNSREILTPEGKDALTAQVVADIKRPFAGRKEGQKVAGVFFTTFVVQ